MNALKFQVLSLCLDEVKVQYERIINNKLSISLNFGYLNDKIGIAQNLGRIEELKGFDINPQVRYYFSGKAPVGIYSGIYGQISKGVFADDSYPLYDFNFHGGGIILGNQNRFDRFILDTYIGGGFCNLTYSGTYQTKYGTSIDNGKKSLFLPSINISLGYLF